MDLLSFGLLSPHAGRVCYSARCERGRERTEGHRKVQERREHVGLAVESEKREAKGKNKVRPSWPLLRYSPFSSSFLQSLLPTLSISRLRRHSVTLSKSAFVLLRFSVSSHVLVAICGHQ